MTVIKGTTITSEELAEAYLEQLKERHDNPDQWRGLQFGHAELDEITGGIRKGEFVVLAGAQKSGKTSAALDWAQRLSKQVQEDELVLFVSLEMSHDSLAGRVMSNLSDIEITKFRDYKLESDDWNKVERGANKLKKLPVLWNMGAYSIEGLEQIVEEYGTRIRLVVVDYFQLMFGNGNRNSKRFEQLEEISSRLKRLTLNYDLSVIALSQQNREALKSIERQKDPNTMAGTQALARDCDLLLLILPYMQDGEEVPHMRKLHIALARNSTVGVTMDAVFSGSYCRFGAPANMEVVGMPEEEEREQYWNR